MAKIKAAKRAEATVAPETSSVRPTRFDPAHKVPRADENQSSKIEESQAAPHSASALESEALTAELAAALSHAESESQAAEESDISGHFSAGIVRQFRTQAQQLAAHLEVRQRELDRREAEFHAQIAKHESQARSARLWFQEHHHELLQRQSAIEEKESEAAAELSGLQERIAEQQAMLQGTFMLPKELADKLSTRQGELSNHDLELLRKLAKDHEAATQLALRQRQTETTERIVQDRQQLLEVAELSLARGQADLEDGWQKLQAERNAWSVQMERQRHKLSDERQRVEAETVAQREALRQRTNHLEMRSASLEQMRAELLQVQRETLEMRLATEEMWAQLSGKAPPAALTQSLARVRAKLAQHFQLQRDDVTKQRSEVESLAAKIAQQHDRLAAQKRDMEGWTIQQQRDVESQAARLAAREEEVEKQHRRMQQVQLQWDADRRELEREIRRLQGEMRRVEAGHLATI